MHKMLFILFISIISISVNAQDNSDWRQGCYYDLHNIRICGKMYWKVPSRNAFSTPGDHIFFKISDADKKQKIKTDQFKAFVMQNDSFVVSHDSVLIDYPIIKVILNNTPLKLYLSLRQNSYYGPALMGVNSSIPSAAISLHNSDNRRYFYGETPDVVTELNRGHFIEIMSKLMADDAELVEAIKAKKYRYGKIDELLKEYILFEANKAHL